jgi:hypothetical protein
MTMSLRKMIRDPEGEAGDPAVFAGRADLTDEEKLRVLQSWRTDLLEMQHAVEENMASVGRKPGDVSARLAEVMAAIAEIGSHKTR